MAHPLGIAGLVANTVGAVRLLRFTGNPGASSPLSHEQLRSLRSTMVESRRRYTFEIWGLPALDQRLGVWVRIAFGSVEKNRCRVLDPFLQRLDHRRSVVAIHKAVIEGRRQVHHAPDCNRALVHHRSLDCAIDADD